MHTKLNIGCGRDIREGWLNLDITPLVGVDIIGDCADPATYQSIPDDFLTHIEMSHLLEHISNPLPMMEALWKKAAPGCTLKITVPHGAHDMAFADPQHVRQYFPSSFQFFAQPAYKRADYGYRGDWDTDKITITCDPKAFNNLSDDKVIQLVMLSRNVAWELQAELRAVKPLREPSIPLEYNPTLILK